ncbi:SDR family NAD(P)-dependent oxidoreductase [Streptomyces sp. NPDC058818]|uniref:SDR family NAD(P)-dependent oxidoreductase n=1 Tax=Streptomyces sp. NPDC058818 TaxID=3346640 RepID=UPI0036BDA246
MKKLDGRIALVTGGGTGIGRAVAHRFDQEGAVVYITGRRADVLQRAAAETGPGVVAVPGDVSDPAASRALMERIGREHGRLDVVVANAGGGTHAVLGELTEEHVDRTFAINVKGLAFTVQEALPLLARGASVTLVGSVSAVGGSPGMSLHAASKAAVHSLARSWAQELGGRGIRVNVLSPGPIETGGFRESQGETPEEADRAGGRFAAMTSLGRMGKPAETASAALFLATDESSFVTGRELHVDGGLAI